MSKEMLNRVSVPGKIFDLIWVDMNFIEILAEIKKFLLQESFHGAISGAMSVALTLLLL